MDQLTFDEPYYLVQVSDQGQLALTVALPLQFNLLATRERLRPILVEKEALQGPDDACLPSSDVYCCTHPIKVNLPSRIIISERSIGELRKATLLSAYAKTSCADFEILQALYNIGLLFEIDDFHLWKELLQRGKIDDALWLEHAVCEHSRSVHPSFVGETFDAQRKIAKEAFAQAQLKRIWDQQDNNDRAIDNIVDEDRFILELVNRLKRTEIINNLVDYDNSIIQQTPNHPRCRNNFLDIIEDDNRALSIHIGTSDSSSDEGTDYNSSDEELDQLYFDYEGYGNSIIPTPPATPTDIANFTYNGLLDN